MRDERKIIQIIPATGWRVLYGQSDGTGEYSDLICWALLDNGDIEPVDSDSSGYPDYFCWKTGNFVGLYGPSVAHSPEDAKRLVAEWPEQQKKTS